MNEINSNKSKINKNYNISTKKTTEATNNNYQQSSGQKSSNKNDYIFSQNEEGKYGMNLQETKGTKIPLRKIKDVVDCVIMGDKKFYIEFKNEDKKEKKTKKIFFEVKNNNIRNEIVAKIKFLMTLNNDK